MFEDVNLGFKHKVALFRPAPGTAVSLPPRPNIQGGETYIPYVPPNPNYQIPAGQQSIPGIPDNIPRYVPPNSVTNANRQQKTDLDDSDGDGKP